MFIIMFGKNETVLKIHKFLLVHIETYKHNEGVG